MILTPPGRDRDGVGQNGPKLRPFTKLMLSDTSVIARTNGRLHFTGICPQNRGSQGAQRRLAVEHLNWWSDGAQAVGLRAVSDLGGPWMVCNRTNGLEAPEKIQKA